ncbi:hypothetical protein RRG08_000886 [Elysia crispata]|uniref:Uncharacterized protein n=1 Tax=Elysia crispata TaxID=231223 RepID=A0AAE0YKD4_9GAST|nr:hypothetical protein RRG08_000886 [Elysia crispata]
MNGPTLVNFERKELLVHNYIAARKSAVRPGRCFCHEYGRKAQFLVICSGTTYLNLTTGFSLQLRLPSVSLGYVFLTSIIGATVAGDRGFILGVFMSVKDLALGITSDRLSYSWVVVKAGF